MGRTNPALSHIRKTGCGSLYLTLVYDEESFKPLAFQFILGRAGGCSSSQLYSLQTVINYCIKNSLDLDPLYDKDSKYSLIGIRCPQIQREEEIEGETPDEHERLNLSCGDTLAKGMRYLLAKLDELKPKKK